MLITADEVSVQTGDTYTGADLARVNSFIADVSASIEAYCRREFADPVPGAIKSVALMEVRRRLNVEPGLADERIGDLAQGFESGSDILTASSMQALDAYLRWISPRMSSIRIVSPLREVATLPAPEFQAPALVQSPDDIVVTGRTHREGLVQVQVSMDGWDWSDFMFAESLDRSDGGFPAWRVVYLAPATSGTYFWRARFKADGDISPWSPALHTAYQV